MGIHSGKFKSLGRVDNMEDCIEMCCKEKDVDAAFLLGKLCYSVKCYNSDLCQIRPAFISSIDMLNVNPAVSFIHNNNDRKGKLAYILTYQTIAWDQCPGSTYKRMALLTLDYTRNKIERRCLVTSIKENTTLIGQIHGAGIFSSF